MQLEKSKILYRSFYKQTAGPCGFLRNSEMLNMVISQSGGFEVRSRAAIVSETRFFQRTAAAALDAALRKK